MSLLQEDQKTYVSKSPFSTREQKNEHVMVSKKTFDEFFFLSSTFFKGNTFLCFKVLEDLLRTYLQDFALKELYIGYITNISESLVQISFVLE